MQDVAGKRMCVRLRKARLDQIDELLKKGNVRSFKKTSVHEEFYVSEGSEKVSQNRSMWHAVITAYSAAVGNGVMA